MKENPARMGPLIMGNVKMQESLTPSSRKTFEVADDQTLDVSVPPLAGALVPSTELLQVAADMLQSEIHKGTRHRKIIGQFGEHLVCNWLSRSGFEASIVDHTGIDIVAFNPTNKRRLGISVKARTRGRGTERSSVTIFEKEMERKKTLDACIAFGSEPWIAVYVETTEFGSLYLMSLQELDSIYQIQEGTPVRFFRMTPKFCDVYKNNCNVFHINIAFDVCNWLA